MENGIDILSRYNFEKIDAHVHLNSEDQSLSEIAEKAGFKTITINTQVPFFPDIFRQKEIAKQASRTHFITTFSIENWGKSGWQEEAIEVITQGMNEGAIGVKIWKNIGMELLDQHGNYVMADHPSFNPIYDFLADNRIPLLAHLGEPKNCWLPVEEMTVTSDRDYFSSHPQYHMYLHKQMPSYEAQLLARDRVLDRFPDLLFIGAHLASIEWNVEKLSDWLDTYPSAGVDLAERVCHLQHQASLNSGKVKEFVETYQDRIIYGSDQIDDAALSSEQLRAVILGKWENEFRFFAESSVQTAWNVEKPFMGLGLSDAILKKLFYNNAGSYYPVLCS